jgi:hypothetical protein
MNNYRSIGLAGLLAAASLTAPLLRGAQEAELKDAAGKTIVRYAVEAPAGIAPAGTMDPTKQVGLFICSPEHNRPTGDELLPVRESLRRLGLSDGYVLLGVHPQQEKFGPADHEPMRKLIAWAMKTYPINPRRIYMYGKGEGAKISGEFGTTNPNLITAAITYSWGWWMMPSELKRPIDERTDGPEYYMVLGTRDLATHINTVRDTYSRMQAKGYHTIYREFDDLGGRTYHPVSNDDAIAWATRLRNKTIPPSPEELKLIRQPALVAGHYPALELVGGSAAGAVVQKLLESKDAAVRAAAAQTCSRAIFDEATLGVLAKKLSDPVAKVRRTAISALAMNAQWRSAVSQHALIAAALNTDPAADQGDRVSAADGLCQAVRLQLHGVRQDPPVFKALVALLSDKNEELRTMAANFLAPIRDPDFRGDAGKPERKTPEGGWQKWIDDITAKNSGYGKDYEVCSSAGAPSEAVGLFCKGRSELPAAAFQSTLKAAELGYAPAQAAVAMMYANGKGVQQNYAEAGNWWKKAAEGGHPLAAANAARAPKTYADIPAGAFLRSQ